MLQDSTCGRRHHEQRDVVLDLEAEVKELREVKVWESLHQPLPHLQS